MAHYVAIIVPSPDRGLRVLFPDIPQCEAEASDMDDARLAAVDALSRFIETEDARLPLPRDLSAIERDEDWMSRNGVDLSSAIVTMISIGR